MMPKTHRPRHRFHAATIVAVRLGICMIAITLLGPGCGGEPGVPRAEHEALLQRLDAMDRRVDALEEAMQKRPTAVEVMVPPERDPLGLPTPRAPGVDAPTVTVHVTATSVEIDGKVVADADLSARFREIAAAAPGTRLTLMSEPDAPYQAIVHAMDVAREAGLTDVAMAVRVHGEGEGAVTAGL